MPRPVKGYVRPTERSCRLCGGPVPVEPVGKPPEAHPECITVLQDVRRLERVLRADGDVRTERERYVIGQWLNSTLRSLANDWVNEYANPSKMPADLKKKKPKPKKVKP